MNNGKCDAKSGKCNCAPGWTGPACEFACSFGQYGFNCVFTCNCTNGASCNKTDGTCLCLSGWSGDR